MRVGFPGAPRLDWYDRNPFVQGATYLGTSVAPHGATIRFTYTVPSGKKFMVTSLLASVIRRTAPTTAAKVSGFIYIMYNLTARAYLLSSTHFSGTVDGGRVLVANPLVLVVAGESVRCTTVDDSTGGTNDFEMSVYGVEFSA